MNAPMCPPPDPNPKKPDIPTPNGACDCHNHVFGPSYRFPYAKDRSYTPPDAPVEDLIRMHEILGFERAVIVQGSAHGTDNSAMLNALEQYPERFRGVAVQPTEITDRELDRMVRLGVQGLRFNHMFKNGQLYYKGGIGIEDFEALHDRMAERGLHMQLWINCVDLPDLWPRIKDSAVPIVVDHMGRLDATRGVDNPGFKFLVNLLGEGKVWVKLSGAYRLTNNWPNYPETRPFHEALVSANPYQCVWGTDWPHPRQEARMPNVGALLDLFNEWTPKNEIRKLILVDNPARFYRFQQD